MFKNSRPPIQTRGAAPARPPIENATALLSTSTQGQQILKDAPSMIEKLCISTSHASPKAGNGLWLLAPESDTKLKNNQVITWYSGRVEFFNEDNAEQASAERSTIGLGATMTNAAQVIISDPSDYDLKGCAYFANHSVRPNCKLKYLRNPLTNGVTAVLLVLNQDIKVPQGHALELVVNYGNSAAINHGILTPCDYIPKPKPINELQGIKRNNHHPKFANVSDKTQARDRTWEEVVQIAMGEEVPTGLKTSPHQDYTLFKLKSLPLLSPDMVDDYLKQHYQIGVELDSGAAAAPPTYNFSPANSFFSKVSRDELPQPERKRKASEEQTYTASQLKPQLMHLEKQRLIDITDIEIDLLVEKADPGTQEQILAMCIALRMNRRKKTTGPLERAIAQSLGSIRAYDESSDPQLMSIN